jgi:uncharacterized membrane protein
MLRERNNHTMTKNKTQKNSIQKELSKNTEKKNNETSTDKRAAKKAIVLGTEKKNRKPLAIFLTAVILFSGGAFFVMSRGGESMSTSLVTTPYVATGATVSQITYPVALFQDGQARHFEHKEDGFTVKYFVLKSSDGIIRAAFDACDVCWPAGKGYYQDGDVMVCRNCGRRFASVRVNEVKGGCNPAPLHRTVEGDQLVIQVKDVLEGKQFFSFSGKV